MPRPKCAASLASSGVAYPRSSREPWPTRDAVAERHVDVGPVGADGQGQRDQQRLGLGQGDGEWTPGGDVVRRKGVARAASPPGCRRARPSMVNSPSTLLERPVRPPASTVTSGTRVFSPASRRAVAVLVVEDGAGHGEGRLHGRGPGRAAAAAAPPQAARVARADRRRGRGRLDTNTEDNTAVGGEPRLRVSYTSRFPMDEPPPTDGIDRRASTRRACLLGVRYRVASGWHPATLVDLSARGCRLRIGEDLARNAARAGRARRARERGRRPSSSSGTVVWCRLEGLSHQAGVHFDDAPTT